MDQQGVITRAALGRMASVGDLYDCRTDQLCNISIFKKAIPKEALKIIDSNFTDVHLIHSDTFAEKFTKLDVKAELSVSVLAGLFSLEGSGRYIMDQKKSGHTLKSSLVYKIQTKDENVNVYHEDLKQAFAIDAIENGSATHVVVGISWGANSVLSCLYENNENKDAKIIEGSLSAQLKKVSLSITGKAAVDLKEGDNDKRIQFDVRIYGDILPKDEDLPTTFEGALTLMKQLPSLVASCNGGKGKPLTYRLIPISLLQKYLNFSMAVDTSLKSLEEACLTRVVQIFDQMSETQQKLHDLYNDATAHECCCVTSDDLIEISKLKNDMAVEETSLRSKLSTVLVDVRSGKKDVSEVESIIQQFQSSPASSGNVTLVLNRWSPLREKISFAKSIQHNGATYIGLGTSLDDKILQNFDSKSFVFFFTQNSRTMDLKKWTGNCQLFFQELKQKEIGHTYFAVDCDIHPNHLPKGASSVIQVLQQGKTLTKDLLHDHDLMEGFALVKLTTGTVRSLEKPNKRVPLTLCCTGINCNPSEEHDWICKKCSLRIEYGFDDHVYCNCGKTPISSLEFKCADPKHGVSFEKHDQVYFKELMSKVRPFRDLNILILGETGVGKSTWINGFLNFVTYESLQEAEAGDLYTLIPSTFTVCDENYDEIVVKTGTDSNEVHAEGESATQDARVYPFHVGNTTIRLIDTPGIGDTRGIEQDQKNFQNILSTLSHLEEIHGICILLKPNNSRLNVMFRFCIQELLTYLHKDASQNIVFCFTNSRGTFYRPGDTKPALMKLLKANKNVEIPLSSKTMYCFDSEAYRFLAAVKNDPPVFFGDDERENFSGSWEKSISETTRLLEHIKSLPPHPIQSTLNLNHARELVLKIVKPLAEINRNNQTNISILEDEKQQINDMKESIKELKKQAWTTRTEIEVTRINYPKTVCANNNCVKVWSTNGTTTTEYVQICHDHCGLSGVTEDSIGHPQLMGCAAMRNGYCRHASCGHHYKEHLHLYYDSKLVSKQVENQAVKESLQKNLSAAEMKQKMIDEKDKEIKEYVDELKEIENASVKFAYFLKVNAITPYNDAMEQYLNHLIKEEENKVTQGGNRKTLDSLIHSRDSYREAQNILDKQMELGRGSAPKPGEIDMLVNKLKGLRLSGKALKDSLECVNFAANRVYKEELVRPPPGGHNRKKRDAKTKKDQKSKSKFLSWLW